MKCLALCSLLLAASVANAAPRPNILLLLVDDLKPALGCYGDTTAQSPGIDALAARGMRFDMAYCNQAVCAPSRFTLMLGSHSTSTGLYGLGSPMRESLPDAVTLPQHFAAAGYRTESLGKIFHIGHGNDGDPASFSQPHFKDLVIEYLNPASTGGGKLTREEALFTNRELNRIKDLPRGAAFESPVAADDAYADGRVASETIRRLQAAKTRLDVDGTPFFIAAGFVRPHLPFSAPKRYWDLYDPASLPMPTRGDFPEAAPKTALKRRGEITAYTPVPSDLEPGEMGEALTRELIHGYYASVSYADAQIARVTAELDRLGLADNTVIVLWGDHGFHLGDLGIWTKHTNYEQANRIPILIVAPGVTAPGSATRQLAESVDIYPTLAELAGLPAPKGPQPIDGKSLVAVLKDPAARVRDHAFHAYPKAKLGRAIRTDRYRLIEWSRAGQPSEYELYDYAKNQVEEINIAASRPGVLKTLQGILATYPEPIGRGSKRTYPAVPSPDIARRTLHILTTANATKPQGVVLAQGGNQHGYALHFIEGRPAFDVRVNGKVTRLMAENIAAGTITFEAWLDAETIRLKVNDGPVISRPSPGLIPNQPKDELSIGEDLKTAAGDYTAPNRFSGTVVSHRITIGKKEE